MRRFSATTWCVSLAAATWLVTGTTAAQDYDILHGSPPTFINVETDYSGNDDKPDCDWYYSAADLINTDGPDDFGRGCQVNIRIRGIINRDGAYLFSNLVKRLRDFGFRPAAIVLDSRGGDADAAIAMARLIRSEPMFTALPVETRIADGPESVCFSACVIVFSAGFHRSLEFNINGSAALPSRLGIHGPGQFDPDNGRYDSAATNAEIQRVSRRLKDYFGAIGVSEALVDDMYAVPFDQIRLLSRPELVDYGLYAD